jgi:asparagine N-glycosylation enzyme membrane subunit Stt3
MREGDVCKVCGLLTLYSMVYILGLSLSFLIHQITSSTSLYTQNVQTRSNYSINPNIQTTMPNYAQNASNTGSWRSIGSRRKRDVASNYPLDASFLIMDDDDEGYSFHHLLLLESRRYSPLHRVDPNHLSRPKPPRPTPVL